MIETVLDNVTGAVFARCLHDTRACRECKGALTRESYPVVVADRRTRTLTVEQAPNRIVHETGIPWNDRSGDHLRQWLQASYDDPHVDRRIAVVSIGFCFPDTGADGGLLPRPECALRWYRPLLVAVLGVRLTLLMGTYAQHNYLDVPRDWTLTDVVRNGLAHDTDNRVLPSLPHLSPRNLAWLKHNPRFDAYTVPALQAALAEALVRYVWTDAWYRPGTDIIEVSRSIPFSHSCMFANDAPVVRPSLLTLDAVLS